MKKGHSPTAWSTFSLPYSKGVFCISSLWLGVNASLLPLKIKASYQKSTVEDWEARFKFLFSLEMGERMLSEKCCRQLCAI